MTDTMKILEEFDKEFMQPDNYPWMRTDVTGNEIKKFLITKIQEAVAEERARVVGVIEVSLMGQNVIFNLVGRGKLEEAQKCNQANHILRTLLASLDKPLTNKE